MKTVFSNKDNVSFVTRLKHKKDRGVALVIVLLILVILAGLILAFFSSVSTETISSGSETAGVSTRALADNAVNIAIGQIVEATRGGSGTDITTWASQPGMIRTYSNAGAEDKIYRLYSSDKLIVSGGGEVSEKIPDDWNQDDNLGVYTDLNAPVMIDTGGATKEPNYPILNPSAAFDSDAPANMPNVAADGSEKVLGFTIPTREASVPGYAGGAVSPTNNNAPMPVKWLYLLEDGSVVPATSAGEKAAKVDGSETSPIKGRIAFWTDDESCKVNINTASEGVYWDMPHVLSYEDIGKMSGAGTIARSGLAIAQPAKGEYQRYPGHPSTTSLSPILGGFGMPVSDPLSETVSSDAQRLKKYYDLAPRVTTGGSEGGTKVPNFDTTTGSAKAIYPAAARLYATVDEFVFKIPTSGATTRPENSVEISKDVLEKTKFFLTANSNAPEVTIFNTPRISMWPEAVDAGLRTTFDNTIAFCSSLGIIGNAQPKFPYYFQRIVKSDPMQGGARSATADYSDIPRNKVLYSYIQNLFAKRPPGYTKSLASKFGTDSDQIITEIFDYIRCTNIFDSSPGSTKYTRHTSLLQTTFSNIGANNNRKGLPSNDAGGGEVIPIQIGDTRGFGRTMTPSEVSIVFYATDWDHSGDNWNFDGSGNPTSLRSPVATLPTYTGNAAAMGAFIVVNFAGVSQGLPGLAPNLRYEIEGIDPAANPKTPNNDPAFAIKAFTGGTPETGIFLSQNWISIFNSEPKASNWIENAPVRFESGRGIGGSDDPNMVMSLGGMKIFPDGINSTPYPRNSQIKEFFDQDSKQRGAFPHFAYPYPRLLIPDKYVTDPTKKNEARHKTLLGLPGTVSPMNYFEFSGGKMLISVYRGEDAGGSGTLLQQVEVYFPPTRVRIPQVKVNEKLWVPPVTKTTMPDGLPTIFPWGGTFARNANTYNVLPQFQIKDTFSVISVEVGGQGDGGESQVANPTAGDLRMVAGMKTVNSTNPQPRFNPHELYFKTTLAPFGTAPIAAGLGGKAYGYMFGDGHYDAGWHQNAFSGVLAKNMNKTKNGLATASPNYQYRRPNVPSRITPISGGLTGVLRDQANTASLGDWDTGWGMQKDGPYINFPDMGDVSLVDIDDKNGQPRIPYLTKEDHYMTDRGGGAYFSPNRMIPSSIMLGSLPTGVKRFLPWQTLLFNPKPEDPSHPGHAEVSGVPDHLVADFFWMPIVEPYAISQPFTTAGKINMNYQIQPFTYIKRATGMYAAMKAVKFMAMNPRLFQLSDPRRRNDDGISYTPVVTQRTRFPIDIPYTLEQFDEKFTTTGLFKTASEICEINLYPRGFTSNVRDAGAMKNFWDNGSTTGNTVTGDNLREKPYADLYPRLTTRSNTFTVHFRVQTLKKSPNTPKGEWVEGKDQVIGEYRGSSIIERYIDVNDPDLAKLDFDFASKTIGTINIDDFYKIRVLNTKRFSP